MKNTIKKSLKVKLRVVFRYLHLKEFISLLAILMSLLAYGQREMTAKEGFYYLYKVSNEKITDDAIKNTNNRIFNMNWFFLYTNTFDKTNSDNARNNEFKWPEYSKRMQIEIYQGKKNADFNKLFSYSSIAMFGKYNSQYGGFPISNGWKRIFSDKQFINYPINIYVGRYWMNKAYLNNFLKMDPKRGEKLVERHPGERQIQIKVIYNVVNKYMKNENKWDKKYLGIYVHKVIYLDGDKVLGVLTPTKEYYDKVNLVLNKPNFISFSRLIGTYTYKNKKGMLVYTINADSTYVTTSTDYSNNETKKREGHVKLVKYFENDEWVQKIKFFEKPLPPNKYHELYSEYESYIQDVGGVLVLEFDSIDLEKNQ